MAIAPRKDGKKPREKALRQKNRGFVIRGRKQEEAEVPGLQEMQLRLVRTGVPGDQASGGEKMVLEVSRPGRRKHEIELWWSNLSGDWLTRRRKVLDAVAHRILEEDRGSGWIRREDADRIVKAWIKDPSWNDAFDKIEDVVALAKLMES